MLSGVRLSCYQEYESAGKPITARVSASLTYLTKKYITFSRSAPFRWTTDRQRQRKKPNSVLQGRNRPAFQREGRAMIVALLNQKGGVGKTTLATHIAGELAMRGQHRHPAGCRPAGFIAGLDTAPQPARLATAVQRRRPRTRNAASGSARTRQAGRSRHHRRAARIAALARSALLAAELRADPGAAQPLRPVGQRRDGGADP